MNTLLLLATLIAPQTEVKVQFDLPKGTVLVYKSVQESNTEAAGNSMSSKSDQTQTYVVYGVEDGWMQVKSTMTEFKLDSDSPMGDMMGDPTGLETTFLVSRLRKVKDLKIENAGKLSSEQAEGFRNALQSEMNGGLDGLTFPEGEMSVGTTWEQDLPPVQMAFGGMKSTMEGKLVAKFKVLEFGRSGDDDTVTIESKTDGSYALSIESPNGSFDLDVTQKETRNYIVRTRDGVIKRVTIESTRDMASQAFDVSTKSKGKMELVETPPTAGSKRA